MRIGSKDYSKSELLRRVGHLHQLGGTRHYKLTEGSSQNVSAIDFNTGSGFCFTVLPDRALDISQATYKGINLVYQTPNSEVNPAFFEPENSGWLRTFTGGLLTTCGLTYFGPPGRDGESLLGLHGRVSTIPARQVCDNSHWQGDEYHLCVSGIIEEATSFGDKIRLSREIRTKIGNKSLTIKDKVENFGYQPAPFTILYHINIGFPLLDTSSKLILTASQTEPYDDHSKANLKNWSQFSAPCPNFQEENYLHKMVPDSQGYAYALLFNPHFLDGDALGVFLKFRTQTLPYLSEWKMLGEGDYVVGIEPCNVKIENRRVLREKGILPFLSPGEEKEMEVEIGILEGQAEINQFKDKIKKILSH
jgi:hypothetical protein